MRYINRLFSYLLTILLDVNSARAAIIALMTALVNSKLSLAITDAMFWKYDHLEMFII